MSNEPGGPAPLPDPYTVPGGHAPVGGPAAPPPSGYEAVLPTSNAAPPVPAGPYSPPVAPYAAGHAASEDASPYGVPPRPASNPFTPPASPVGSFAGPAQHETQAGSPYGTPPGYGSPYGPAPTGTAYGSTYGGSPYGAPPAAGHPAFGSAGYGQPPEYGSPYGTPYGAGPYGPYGPGYPGPAPTSQTEPLAIASIATSIGGLVILGGLTGAVGLFLGIAALRRIRTNGKQGRGLAITGIAVGSVGIAYLVFVAFLLISLFAGAAWTGATSYDESDYGTSTDDGWSDEQPTDDTIPSYSLRTDLQVGDCLDVYSYEWDMSDTNVVACTLPHEGEVLSLVTLTGPASDTYDSADPVMDAAWDECLATADILLPERTDIDVMVYAPHPDAFASGRTTAYCTFFTYEEPIEGSAVDHTLASAPGSAT